MTTLSTTLISLHHVDTDEKQNKTTRSSSLATPKVLSMISSLITTHPDAILIILLDGQSIIMNLECHISFGQSGTQEMIVELG